MSSSSHGPCQWQRDFIFAKSLKVSRSASVLPRRRSGRDEWLEQHLRQLKKESIEGLRGKDPVEQEKVYRLLTEAGRDLDRGFISRDTYDKYVSMVLNQSTSAANASSSSSSSKPSARRRPASARVTRSMSQPPPEKAREEEPGARWQARVRARSARERARTMAWVERVAAKNNKGPPQPEDDVAERRVLITQVPARVEGRAVREALEKRFGAVSRVERLQGGLELDGSASCVATFVGGRAARAAVQARSATLGCVVQVSPVPKDCDEKRLASLMAEWGKVVSVRFLDSAGRTSSGGGQGKNNNKRAAAASASVVFATESAAAAANGERVVEAANELIVSGVPSDAGEEHLRRCYGGQREGVTKVELDKPKRQALVVFESAALCARALGHRELVVTTQGGVLDSLERSQQAARKGAAPPWHTTCPDRPFADYDLHSFQFGHAPTSTKEFNRRAAGTYLARTTASAHTSGAGGAKLAGAAARYSTRRCPVHAKLRTLTLYVRQIQATIYISAAP